MSSACQVALAEQGGSSVLRSGHFQKEAGESLSAVLDACCHLSPDSRD